MTTPDPAAARPAARALLVGGVLACVVVAALWLLLERARPLPFATSGDSWFYFLPLLVRTNAQLRDHGSLAIDWSLGVGYSPFESGQLAPGYPVYALALAVTRALQRPEAMLEVSALLHALLVVVVVMTRSRAPAVPRTLAAIALAIQPGALLYGLGPHCYFAALPWWCGAAICVVDLARDDDTPATPLPSSTLPALLAFELLFFWVAHLQMFVVGNLLLVAVVVAAAPGGRALVRALSSFALVGLPFVVPLWHFRGLGEQMVPHMKAVHGGVTFFETSQQPLAMLTTMGSGGAIKPAGAIGGWMYFNPLFVVVVVAALAMRAVRAVGAALCAFFLLCPAIVPRAWWFDPVLLRVRDPGKTATLLGALCIVVVLAVGARRSTSKRVRTVVTVLLALTVASSIWADSRGQSQLPMPAVHNLGAAQILRETRRGLRALQIPDGARIAIVGTQGRFYVGRNIPLPLLGLSANLPPLSGVSTAHVYEPLEPAPVAQAHLSLGAPWFEPLVVPAARVRAHDDGLLQRLRDLGVTHLVGTDETALRAVGTPRLFKDRNGMTMAAVALDPPPVAFPSALVDGVRVALQVQEDGTLVTSAPSSSMPDARALARPVRWTQLQDGRWRGDVELLPRTTVLVSFAVLLAVAAVVVRRARRRAPTAAARADG